MVLEFSTNKWSFNQGTWDKAVIYFPLQIKLLEFSHLIARHGAQVNKLSRIPCQAVEAHQQYICHITLSTYSSALTSW